MFVRVEAHPNGRRLHVGRYRIHHYHSGAALIVLGSWWIYKDRADLKLSARGLPNPLASSSGGRLRAGTPALAFNPEIGHTTDLDPDGW